jgi:hypothetical protein
MKELKKNLMQADQTLEIRSSLKKINKEIEIHDDHNAHHNSGKDSH